MDQFIKDINSLIKIANDPVGKQPLIEHNTIEKQYIAYYLYRILCKYETLFETTLSYAKLRNIYDLLRIPEKKKRGCYPMAHKMTNDSNLLDIILLGLVELFNQLNENLKMSLTNNNFTRLKNFLATKKLEVIIQDLIDIQHYVPNLAAPAVKPYIYKVKSTSKLEENKDKEKSLTSKQNSSGQKKSNNTTKKSLLSNKSLSSNKGLSSNKSLSNKRIV